MGEIGVVHEFIVISKATAKKADLAVTKEKLLSPRPYQYVRPLSLLAQREEVLWAEVGHKCPRLNQLPEILTNYETLYWREILKTFSAGLVDTWITC